MTKVCVTGMEKIPEEKKYTELKNIPSCCFFTARWNSPISEECLFLKGTRENEVYQFPTKPSKLINFIVQGMYDGILIKLYDLEILDQVNIVIPER